MGLQMKITYAYMFILKVIDEFTDVSGPMKHLMDTSRAMATSDPGFFIIEIDFLNFKLILSSKLNSMLGVYRFYRLSIYTYRFIYTPSIWIRNF